MPDSATKKAPTKTEQMLGDLKADPTFQKLVQREDRFQRLAKSVTEDFAMGIYLPTWGVSSDAGRTSGWVGVRQLPEDTKKWMPRLKDSKKFMDALTDEIKEVLSDPEYSSVLSFEIHTNNSQGPSVYIVPGNACGIMPNYRGDGYDCHNVDNRFQADALAAAAIVLLKHLYRAIDECERDPNAFSDGGDRGYREFKLPGYEEKMKKYSRLGLG
ncbi:MAG TPA: hypothetical protein VL944_00695 [Candidatus Acidoferrum sp.]|nr:hypothetical protein [Candidatus Acidoferrum sp.]